MRKFIEISDYNQTEFNNSDLYTKLIRIFIRFSFRIAGFKFGLLVIKKLIYFNGFFERHKKSKFISYILKINYFYFLSLFHLHKNNIEDYVKNKLDLSKIILNESYEENQIENAQLYNKIIKIFKNQSSFSSLKLDCSFSEELKRNSSKKFYIYGPSSDQPPDIKYKEFTLITFKPYVKNIEQFNHKILFINAFYYLNHVLEKKELKNYILNTYDECIVSISENNLIEGFTTLEKSSYGHLCSLMGLGRIIFHLIKKYGKFDCVIEGADFYLSDNPYSKNYPSQVKNNKVNLYENFTCTGLSHHDFIFNFIYTKFLIENLTLIDSLIFKNFLSLDAEEYVNKLITVRDFKQLKKILYFR